MQNLDTPSLASLRLVSRDLKSLVARHARRITVPAAARLGDFLRGAGKWGFEALDTVEYTPLETDGSGFRQHDAELMTSLEESFPTLETLIVRGCLALREFTLPSRIRVVAPLRVVSGFCTMSAEQAAEVLESGRVSHLVVSVESHPPGAGGFYTFLEKADEVHFRTRCLDEWGACTLLPALSCTAMTFEPITWPAPDSRYASVILTILNKLVPPGERLRDFGIAPQCGHLDTYVAFLRTQRVKVLRAVHREDRFVEEDEELGTASIGDVLRGLAAENMPERVVMSGTAAPFVTRTMANPENKRMECDATVHIELGPEQVVLKALSGLKSAMQFQFQRSTIKLCVSHACPRADAALADFVQVYWPYISEMEVDGGDEATAAACAAHGVKTVAPRGVAKIHAC